MNGVSIVICCYNAAKRIVPTLQHLQQQELTTSLNWEVIIVDNASGDNTSAVAAETWKEKPVTKFRIVLEEKPGLMNARHKGLAEAKYEIVSFIDDDNWVEPLWVQKVFEIFSMNKKIGACGGKSEAVFESNKAEWFDKYQNGFAVGIQGEKSGIIDDNKGFLWGAGLSVRNSLWQDLQKRGFKNLTLGREGKNINAGEDSELCYAIRLLGYHLYYREDLLLKHFIPQDRMNINYLAKMCEGFGKANARLNSYRVLLGKESFTIHPWWYEWIATKRKIIFLNLQHIFVFSIQKKIGIIANRAYNKGYAKQVWVDKKKIQLNIDFLKKVFM